MRPSLLLATVGLLACSGTTTPTPTDAGTPGDNPVTSDTGTPPADAPAGCTTPESTDPLVLRTDRGLLRGAMDDGTVRWLGIPYAAPPVGTLRWRPPAPVSDCWTEARDATQWAPSCPQVPQQQGQPFDPNGPIEGQEDCLTLNVWRPANAAADATLPIMVFVHGGGNVVGSAGETGTGGQRLYDAARLAARGDVVVVTVQYRLGALGWLVHPGLEAEAGGATMASNLALRDMVEALRWVQRNARAMRGDAARVMVFGESAGAVNTCTLVASPLAAGLFSRALMQSGSCGGGAGVVLDAARAQGVRYATAAGCGDSPDVPSCLRGITLETAMRTLPAVVSVSGLDPSAVRWGPAVGAAGLPEVPQEAIANGRHNRVALMVGHNAEEVGLTVPAIPTEAAYRAALVQLGGGAFADGVMMAYPVSRYGTPRAALVQALSDARFGCPARLASRAGARGNGPMPQTFRYLYAHPLEGGTPLVRALGAWHGVELLYVFQNTSRPGYMATAGDLAVERLLLGYWTRFAATGNPNGGDALAWPAYATGEPLLRLAPTPEVVQGWRNTECDGWDAITRVTVPAP